MTGFEELAAAPDATLDRLALAMAAEFRKVDVPTAMASLDTLGADLSVAAERTSGSPEEVAAGPTAVAPVLPLTIVKGKDQGAATGFQVADARGRKFMLKFDVDDYQFTVFPDGRAIIKGTDDPDKAKTLYAKYVGH